jgi:hypothetical protein
MLFTSRLDAWKAIPANMDIGNSNCDSQNADAFAFGGFLAASLNLRVRSKIPKKNNREVAIEIV